MVRVELKEVQRHWDAFGKTDPLWAIVTRPDKRYGKWKYDEFLACGEEEIDRILRHVDSISFSLCRGRALDFGCGAGRLTQALSRRFQQCHGIDIAPSMIELAQKYDQPWQRFQYEILRLWRSWRSGRVGWAESWPGLARLLRRQQCRYVVHESGDLALFKDDTFDLVYSSLVLQHMKPAYSLQYIKEFLRVIAPKGLIILQIPSRPVPEREVPYKAGIRVARTSLIAKPGERITLTVRVQNRSDCTWPAVRLGNHWLSETGALLVSDDGRTSLPSAMKPRQEIEVAITVTAPKRPGPYQLEFDVVQESVLWFQTMGSETLKIPCQVQATRQPFSAICRGLWERMRASRAYRTAALLCRKSLGAARRVVGRWNRGLTPPVRQPAASTSSSPPDFQPIMETYGIPRDVVVKWIEAHGGSIVDIQKDISVGKDWESFRYYITKP
jgi:SAM-dependent methyltransferase